MIQLNPDRRLGKCFFFCLQVIDSWSDRPSRFAPINHTTNTDICTLVKAAVAGILVISFQVVLYLAVLYGIFVYPVQSYGWIGVYGIVTLFVLLGLIVAAFVLGDKYEPQLKERKYRRALLKRKREELKKLEATAEPKIRSLFRTYLQSIKDRTCIRIKWTESPELRETPATKFFGAPWGLCLILVLIGLFVVLALDGAIYGSTRLYAYFTEPNHLTIVSCTRLGSTTDGQIVYVNTLCGEQKLRTGDQYVINFFLNNPNGALQCTLKGEDLDCPSSK